MDGWFDFCIRCPGPLEKTGYAGNHSRTAGEVEGEVKHSMEGYLAGALARLMTPYDPDDPYTHASWHFSVPKVGPPLQHYPIFGDHSICWHCGLAGDRRVDTSLIGNLTLVGIEHEDAPDDKLSDSQLAWTVEISRAVRDLCPRVAANPPALRVNLWEHRWLVATSCPSGLIPWDAIIERLSEEEKIMMTLIQGTGRDTVYAIGSDGRKHHILDRNHLEALRALGLLEGGGVKQVNPVTVDAIPDGSGSGGSTT